MSGVFDTLPPFDERVAAGAIQSISNAQAYYERYGEWPEWADEEWARQNREDLAAVGVSFD